jgi:hypothetical protein
MPRWTDLTPDQCADVRVDRDLVAFGPDGDVGRWPLAGVGVGDLRDLFGAGDEDPMYDGWTVGAAHAERLERLAGRPIDLATAGYTVEASGAWAARLALEGGGGFLFVELLDHRRLGLESDGWVLIEVNLSLFGPHVCVLPWFSAPVSALDGFCAQLAGAGGAALELYGGLSVEVDGDAFSGRIRWPEWVDLRFGPVAFERASAAASAEAFRPQLEALG